MIATFEVSLLTTYSHSPVGSTAAADGPCTASTFATVPPPNVVGEAAPAEAAVGGKSESVATVPLNWQSVRSSVRGAVALFALVSSVTTPSVATAPTLHGPPAE